MPATADRLFGLSVRFNGVEKPELYNCAETFRVTEEIGHGSTVHLVVMVCRNDDGSWPHLEEAEMGAWQRVTVTVTVGSHKDVLMDGYISHIHVEQTPQTATLKATFTVVDVSYIMGLRPRCKVWPAGKSYEDIAKEIITGKPYNLKATIETNPPQAGNDEPRSTVQRGSDLQFLRELARRRGYEFYVLGATGYFRKPVLEGTPQKAIASNFGERTNCENLHIFVDATAPLRAVAARVDPYSGKTVAVDATTDCGLTPMGTTDVSASRDDSSPVPPTTVLVRRPPALSEAELKAFLKSFDRSTPLGRRDFAMALCLCRLGLRGLEVASLRLEDVNWSARTLHLRDTKSRRARLLPLPPDVAKALSTYCEDVFESQFRGQTYVV